MPPLTLKPYWQTRDKERVRLYQGDALSVLGKFPAGSIQCVVTSPPYWEQRKYFKKDGLKPKEEVGREDCTVDEYISDLRGIFREVYRVLREDGTVWLNLGDTYPKNKLGGVALGNTVGIPWQVAFALRNDAWIIRQDIIWTKPAPSPDGVKDRCTKAHEYIFLLVKQRGYYYDPEPIKTPALQPEHVYKLGKKSLSNRQGGEVVKTESVGPIMANKRSVWRVATEPYEGSHTANFPPKLIEPMILAGTSEHGACVKCGSPWIRQTERVGGVRAEPDEDSRDRSYEWSRNGKTGSLDGIPARIVTTGWKPSCGCNCPDVRPCIVLDPFIGSGTTAAVALGLNRSCWGIDLSKSYLDQCAIPRIEGILSAIPQLAHLTGREAKRVTGTSLLKEQ